MQEFTCGLPVKVVFGVGRVRELGEMVGNYGKKVFLAIDPYLDKSGLSDEMIATFKKASLDAVKFTEIHPNPICFEVDRGATLAREQKCDVIVAVGGGSTIDSAKIISFLAKNPGKTWEYIEKKRPRPKEALPIIAVPTTAGTGSEVTLWSVVSNPDLKDKKDFDYEITLPKVALVDPGLMVSMPRGLTASTGVDALSHSLETFVSTSATPFSKLISRESIRLAARYLPEAVANGSNLEARSQVAWASTLGGIAIIHARTTVPHALGTAAGALLDAPHGGAIAACLVKVLEYSYAGNFEVFAELAEAFDDSVRGLPLHEKAEKSVELMQRLFKEMDYEVRYRDFGVTEKDIDRLTDWLKNSNYWNELKTHPKHFTADDIRRIYRESL